MILAFATAMVFYRPKTYSRRWSTADEMIEAPSLPAFTVFDTQDSFGRRRACLD